jgi:hypothetical protein
MGVLIEDKRFYNRVLILVKNLVFKDEKSKYITYNKPNIVFAFN